MEKTFDMKKLFFACLMVVGALQAWAQTGDLPREAPETVGIRASSIVGLIDSLVALPQTSIHSVMVLRHGKVVGEAYPAPFSPESMHTMYSCSKTFVAAAIGIAIDEGKLNVDDKVASFFPKNYNRSANYRKMTVRDLLTMSAGIAPDWVMRNNTDHWTAAWLGKTVAKPGQRFDYDSMCTYLLSVILQKATGTGLLDYLKSRVFNPMHITQVEWEESPEGYATGGWGLRIQAESLAKFGLLLLNDGMWKGQQLVPAQWVRAMKAKQIDNWAQGYGYQMWPCEYPGAVRADGAYGQYILMVPDKDMVVVITECTAIDGIRQRRLVWRGLLPTVGDGVVEPETSYALYRRKLDSYALPTPEGTVGARQIAHPVVMKLERNPLGWSEITVEPIDTLGTLRLSYVQHGRRVVLPLYHGLWNAVKTEATPVYSIQARSRFKGVSGPFTVAGSYGMMADGRLKVSLHYTDWITSLDLTIPLDGAAGGIGVSMNHEKEYAIKVAR